MHRRRVALSAVGVLGVLGLLGCGIFAPSNPAASTGLSVPFTLSLERGAAPDDGILPVEYTCDGAGVSPPLAWDGAPRGTKEFALLMTTLPGDGTTKWNWVLYRIPSATTSLERGTTGVGVSGAGSHGGTLDYEPPCSQGSGPKAYTFTLYALSEPPVLPNDPREVTGDVLTRAILPVTVQTASFTVSYTRP